MNTDLVVAKFGIDVLNKVNEKIKSNVVLDSHTGLENSVSECITNQSNVVDLNASNWFEGLNKSNKKAASDYDADDEALKTLNWVAGLNALRENN